MPDGETSGVPGDEAQPDIEHEPVAGAGDADFGEPGSALTNVEPAESGEGEEESDEDEEESDEDERQEPTLELPDELPILAAERYGGLSHGGDPARRG